MVLKRKNITKKSQSHAHAKTPAKPDHKTTHKVAKTPAKAEKKAPKKEAHAHTPKKAVKKEETFIDYVKQNPWKLTSVILAVFLLLAIVTNGFTSAGVFEKVDFNFPKLATNDKAPTGEASEVVKLDLYVMSQCPYGTQAMDAAIEAKNQLGSALELNFEYIFYDQAQYAGQEAEFCHEELCSMHGVSENLGDFVQLCALDQDKDEAFDMITCMNENAGQIPGNWEACAKKTNLDVEKLRTCYEGDQALELARASSAKSKAVNAQGSPTIFMNDVPYSGKRSGDDFVRAACAEYKEERPEACANIPEPVKVKVTVVEAKECTTCNPEGLNGALKRLFPGAQFETIYVEDAEGKALVEKYNLEVAPAFILDENLMKTAEMKSNPQLANAFTKMDDGSFKINDQETGSTYFLDEEKRKEQEELLNAYASKNLEFLGADGSKPRLDYFVMSFCPYGNPADVAAHEVYKLFGDKVEVVPHYIMNVQGEELSALHGVQEANQQVRELCVLENEGMDMFFDFTLKSNDLCSSNDADTCWTKAAEAVGADVEAVKTCFETKSLEIAKEQEAQVYGTYSLYNGELRNPSASPSFLIDGETYNGGRDAESIKAALCSKFENKPAECDLVIAAPEAPAPAAGSC